MPALSYADLAVSCFATSPSPRLKGNPFYQKQRCLWIESFCHYSVYQEKQLEKQSLSKMGWKIQPQQIYTLFFLCYINVMI